MSSGKKRQSFLHGAAILTVGVIIMKILGACYKIPLGNILGDEGYSMFIGAYSIYSIFFILSTAGFPIALSRMVAEADAHGRVKQERKLFKVALLTFSAIGLVFALAMFFGNEWLAAVYLENPDAALSVRAMAPAIFLVCVVSAYRGYFQGNGNMLPTTVDEVLEVLFKVISGLIISSMLINSGQGLQKASAGAIYGVSIGGLVSVAFMVAYKYKHSSSLDAPYIAGRSPEDLPGDEEIVDSAGKIVKEIFRIGIPIALGSCIMAILNSVDSKLCMNRLQSAAGFSYLEAKILYGVYGKAQTIFNLPAAIITPLTISIVPAIANALALNKKREASKLTEDALRICTVLALPMGVGLLAMSVPIMHSLYPSSHGAGPGLLSIFGVASFFVCIVLVENAILQASGKERLPMYSMIIGSLVKIVVNWFLVANRGINIYGAPTGTTFGYIVMAVMNYVFMCRSLNERPRLTKVLLGPAIASALMGISAFGSYTLLARVVGDGDRLHVLICLAAAIMVAVAVYITATVLLRTVTREDLEEIPITKRLLDRCLR